MTVVLWLTTIVGTCLVWLLKVALQTIVQREYGTWGYALARLLVRFAGRLTPSRSDEWTAELTGVHDEDRSGLDFALSVGLSAARLRV